MKVIRKEFLLILVLLISISGCLGTEPESSSFEGRYVGYSWRGEARGVSLKDANQYIETILELNEDGVIKDAKMRFYVKKDGYWITRQSGNAYVDVDFSVDPTPATPGNNYQPGESMFTVYTADMMSFYAVAVDSHATVAVAIVDPITRYQFEMKFPSDFDFNTPFNELTIGSGLIVPTIRTSTSGLIKPSDWGELSNRTLLNISPWSHVIDERGVLKGITQTSSVKTFLEALGVVFNLEQAETMTEKYGYFGLGGWSGNYSAVESYLIGKNATEITSFIDWSIPRYQGGINDNNQFGIEVQSGATRTVQDSIDGIAGATVRMSRESTSYQRALVQAGIIEEADVIIGRF